MLLGRSSKAARRAMTLRALSVMAGSDCTGTFTSLLKAGL
jgi:hypothetical protein